MGVIKMDKKLIRDKYIDNLSTEFIPFWENAIDNKFGGVFTCYSNDGSQLVSEDKYTWSQGRFLWVTEALLTLRNQGVIKLNDKWETNFKKTYEFLKEYTMMENGHIAFAVKKDGKKIGDKMDTSIFADCFFVIGLSAYAKYYKDSNAFNIAYETFEIIKRRIQKGDFRSEPYPADKSYTSHSIPMILINVSEEIYLAAKVLNDSRKDLLKTDMDYFLNEILKLTTDKRIIEMKHENPSIENLLTSHLNPGHTLESIWFMFHSMKETNRPDYNSINKRLEKIARIAIDKGWDEVNGGLLRFVHKDGGEPKGEQAGTTLETLIKDTWDMKLWWPHSEALYTTLLLFEITEDEDWLTTYKQMEDYVFKTFPNKDKSIGEWIQIRNRQGNPEEKVVALPVKDPFHIIRNIVLIIRLLGESNVTRKE